MPSGLLRALRLALIGVTATPILLALAATPAGALYVWLMTGLSPIAQLRQGGFGVLVMWPTIGILFAGLHVAAAFMMEPRGPWGIVGVTACLLALWVIAKRRGCARGGAAPRRVTPEEAGGRTRR